MKKELSRFRVIPFRLPRFSFEFFFPPTTQSATDRLCSQHTFAGGKYWCYFEPRPHFSAHFERVSLKEMSDAAILFCDQWASR